MQKSNKLALVVRISTILLSPVAYMCSYLYLTSTLSMIKERICSKIFLCLNNKDTFNLNEFIGCTYSVFGFADFFVEISNT